MTISPAAVSTAKTRLQSRMSADRALTDSLQAQEKKDKAAREQQKKNRALHKAAEEQAAKEIRDANRALSVISPSQVAEEDSITGDINVILSGLNESDASDDPTEDPESQVTTGKLPEDSPEKKKGRPASNLKPARYSSLTATPNQASKVVHDHSHKRVIVEAAVTLNASDKFMQFLTSLGALMSNAQLVDPNFIINAIDSTADSNKHWVDAKSIPANMTALGENINISTGSIRAFEQRPWASENDKNKASTVYFEFAVSCDKNPGDILHRIGIEWARVGGIRLSIKTLPSFDTVTAFAIYFLLNDNNGATILSELRQILGSARDLAKEEGNIPLIIPSMNLKKQFPKIPGQDTSSFGKLSSPAQQSRKVWHIEVESVYVPGLRKLIEVAKTNDCVKQMWGKHAHITETIGANGEISAGELKRLVKVSLKHANYQCSMTSEDIQGIVHLDASSAFQNLGHISLRDILLRHFKMTDGYSLIAEIHQDALGPVSIVHPNTAEAETMVLMMNRQVAAYLFYYLTSKGVDGTFVRELLSASCDATLVEEIGRCQWDNESMTLTTPADQETKETDELLENAIWYKDEMGILAKEHNKKKPYTAMEALFNIDSSRSVITLHERNDKHRGKTVSTAEEDAHTDSASINDDTQSHPLEGAGLAPTTKEVGWRSNSSVEFLAPMDATPRG